MPIDNRTLSKAIVVLLALFIAIPFAVAHGAAPIQAISVGYRLNTFASNFTSSDVDLSNTGRPGFKWYLWRFFGSGRTNTNTIRLNGDSSVTLLGDKNSKGGNIATAAPARTPEKFVGTAFGGGAYFEAVFKFNPSTVVLSRSWPAFWSMALEHLVSMDSVQWRGKPKGYRHFIEPDFFEYDIPGGGNYYGGAIHDWYGVYNQACKPFCGTFTPYYKRQVPPGTNFNAYHRYGFLWVPATATRAGYAEYYFDNQRVGQRTTWTMFNDAVVPSASVQPWTFGIMDRQHLVLVLGTGVGEPMTVAAVYVWQASAANNQIGR